MKPRERLPREVDVQKGRQEEIGKSAHRNTHVRYELGPIGVMSSADVLRLLRLCVVCDLRFYGVNGLDCSSQWSVIRNC